MIAAADLAIPVGIEILTRLLVHRHALAERPRGRVRARLAVVRRREHHEPLHLLRMLRRIAGGARAAARPRDERHAIDMPQRADVVDRRADIIPIRDHRRQRVRIARRARRLDEAGLLLLRQVAGIVHRRRTRRAAVARHVDGEHIEARLREKRHPAVVLIRDVERHFGRRSRAVHEQHDVVARCGRAAREHSLAHVELRRLSLDGRHRRLHLHVMIGRQQLRRARRFHPFERVAVVAHAVVHFADEEVPLRIDGEAVRVEELARVVAGVAADVLDKLHRFAVVDANRLVRAVHHVEEALLLVRREDEVVHRAFLLQRVPGDEHLLHERPIRFENLQPVVRAVGDVDEIVVRDEHRVHRVVELRRRVAGDQLRARRELVAVLRLLAVRAPRALELPRLRVEDDDAVVEVAVGHEQLVGFLVEEQARGTADVLGVVAPLVLSRVADLHQELAVARELQDLVLFLRASRQPHVVLVVDEDAVLGLEPLIPGTRLAPRLQQPAIGAELEHARRRDAAFGRRRSQRRAALAFRNRPGAVKDPDVVVRVDRDAADGTGRPPVGQRLRPERIGLEDGNLSVLRGNPARRQNHG